MNKMGLDPSGCICSSRARKLAERLRLHDLKPVYHGETGVRMLRELGGNTGSNQEYVVAMRGC